MYYAHYIPETVFLRIPNLKSNKISIYLIFLAGPRHWHKLFPDGCSGKQQSPIDITTQSSEHDPKLGDFAIWHDPPKPGSLFKVKNNGHSSKLFNRCFLKFLKLSIIHNLLTDIVDSL